MSPNQMGVFFVGPPVTGQQQLESIDVEVEAAGADPTPNSGSLDVGLGAFWKPFLTSVGVKVFEKNRFSSLLTVLGFTE
jgi:hypothetical protein